MTNLLIRSFIVIFLITFNVDAKAENNVLSKEETKAVFAELLASHKGKIIYLDFWASWCSPCRRSFPWLNDLTEEYSKDKFVVLSVNVDNEREFAEAFLKETPAKFDIFYDPKGTIARQYKIKGMPSSYIIDREGNILSSHVGFTEKKKHLYKQAFDTLLKQ
mgnify:CR=1 FL=1